MMAYENPFEFHRRPMSLVNKPVVYCLNCCMSNHVYRNCNSPKVSLGLICYQLHYDENTNSVQPLFLMVQRKDSLSYVEFIRGKYDIQNRQYLIKLFSHMTEDERTRIRNNSFEFLWKSMWCKTDDETNKNFTKEYNDAHEKFAMLQKGYYLKTDDKMTLININTLLDSTLAEFSETEWGFPKGRRNINEDDLSCAVREFKEETGIHPKCIRLCQDIKPLEEVFSGTNKVRYKHIYYVAKYFPLESNGPSHPTSAREIRSTGWFTYNDVIEKIRPYNVERKELVKRCNNIIMKTIKSIP